MGSVTRVRAPPRSNRVSTSPYVEGWLTRLSLSARVDLGHQDKTMTMH